MTADVVGPGAVDLEAPLALEGRVRPSAPDRVLPVEGLVQGRGLEVSAPA